MNPIRKNLLRRHLPSLGIGVVLGAMISAQSCSHSQPQPSGSRDAISETIDSVGQSLGPAPAFARLSSEGTAAGDASLADVAERVVPSVVSISTTRVVRARPRHPFFREFFGGPGGPRQRQHHGLGSGVIVSDEGVVLTNNHVVEQADDILVRLADGRELDAELVGTDPQSDLAVVRIKGKVPEDLEALPFGDSTSMRLGDVVLAVGNPFGVGQTVTMGIVSAKGRSRVGIVDYEDFIQTDAAINPGNSGGALVNMRGELVGINTAILSRSGGYQGVGFAIPAHMARPIMESLLSDGQVARGWLGVSIQTLDQDLAMAMGLELDKGVLVSGVMPDSPAAKAGLERGDVLVSLEGKPVADSSQLRNRIAARQPGSKVTLELVRSGKRQRVEVELGALSQAQVASSGQTEIGPEDEGLLTGVSLANLTPQVRGRFDIPEQVRSGVVVTGVAPGSPAQRLGLAPGDVILEFDRKPVDSVATFDALNRQAGNAALLLVSRQGNTIFLALRR